MKKYILILAFLTSSIAFCQEFDGNYSSKAYATSQNGNPIDAKATMVVKLYFTIKGDEIRLYTNSKRTKNETIMKLGDSERGDYKDRISIKKTEGRNNEYQLLIRTVDTFTNVSSQVLYLLRKE